MQGEIRSWREALLPYGAAFALILAMVAAAAALGDRRWLTERSRALAVT